MFFLRKLAACPIHTTLLVVNVLGALAAIVVIAVLSRLIQNGAVVQLVSQNVRRVLPKDVEASAAFHEDAETAENLGHSLEVASAVFLPFIVLTFLFLLWRAFNMFLIVAFTDVEMERAPKLQEYRRILLGGHGDVHDPERGGKKPKKKSKKSTKKKSTKKAKKAPKKKSKSSSSVEIVAEQIH